MKYYPLLTANRLNVQRQGYDRNCAWVVFYKDAAFRDRLIDFYQRAAEAAQEVLGAEQLMLQNPTQKHFVEDTR